MYNPFKRAQSKVKRQIRRNTAAAVASMFEPFRPPKPKTKRKTTKTAKPATKTATKPRARASKASQTAKTPATSRAKTTTPRGASFKRGVHVCEFGQRSFNLYTPVSAKTATGPLPLLVMLHGCGQTPDDFARGTGMNVLAEEFGFLVVYPAQERRTQIYRCWNWYKRDDQGRGQGEPALIASLTRRVIAENDIDPAKVYIAGLSAGASASLIIASAYPDIFAAVGAHSGLPVGAAHDERSAIVAMQHGAPGDRNLVPMPTINFHGGSDKVVHPRNGRFVASRALEPYSHLPKSEKTGRVPGGRKYVKTMHRIGKGRSFVEQWVIADSGHAWSGGNAAGSYTDPDGPDASRAMVRFFLRHRTTVKRRSAAPA
ncbi:alpha/beta hydrolase family esterase [Paracoccus tegillarcae]|uniref:PHB depolymerase esterase n=1 Tax=Paracoccus tegillarcae TaxID=1529068 RepID=A0A2K9ENZ1_9RHOB|nr:PHB depolymerase family esterase [Paracoccus tegillarcae]AUH32426.1 PHB depolymerase esterase [Paracoccus tegillarcae]